MICLLYVITKPFSDKMGAADEDDEQQSIFSFHLLEPDEYRRLRKKIRLTPGVLLLAGIFLALIIDRETKVRWGSVTVILI